MAKPSRPPLFERLLTRKRRRLLLKALVFLAATLPVAAVSAIGYAKLNDELTERALSRRAVIAELAGRTVQDRLVGMLDVGKTLATRVAFRGHVENGRWDEAIAILKNVPTDFPVIDRVFLTDVEGTHKTDVPPRPEVRGQNFAHRDWYQGVSKEWEPYVSDVYQRAAEPRRQVVALAVPIRDSAGEKVTGILVLQVRLDTFLGWLNGVRVGDAGNVYATDRNGRLMAHPRFDLSKELIDFSQVQAVRDAMNGTTGVGITHNPFEAGEYVSANWRSPPLRVRGRGPGTGTYGLRRPRPPAPIPALRRRRHLPAEHRAGLAHLAAALDRLRPAPPGAGLP